MIGRRFKREYIHVKELIVTLLKIEAGIAIFLSKIHQVICALATDIKEGKNPFGDSYDEEANEFVTFFNEDFSTEVGEFQPISEEFFLKVKS
ncbi:hypothetical protein HP570_14335 [Brevibacillus sp. RS1.1]|uniref:hypothetical protein n=1 Tax=Brevibacillus sp. RS1.1 TaxID=2738982 RepID=UPI00156B73E5|nr:hypothetical protein [Brevibacillus sp. RS1.1]NRR03393.1 hypothetical protein [Brevibacillus sp. RS1.1]